MIYTVSQVNKYVKALINEVPQIRNIYISGEISNYKHYYQSGHMYFTLKDEKSQLKSVMFAFDNQKLKFEPENGMQVVCFGQIDVYERDGIYQLYVRDMQPQGIGSLTVAFEQLKEKLEKEGLFAQEHKKPIEPFPKKIGVATSNIGAAVEDIKNVISRRYPLCELIICPTVVQGDSAAPDIVKSIERLDKMGLDAIIVGRGGGSIEDLWAFNTELVARAVFNCKTPVISAVGHETDFTICDFVADLRAPTPSAAAEIVSSPEISSERQRMNLVSSALEKLIFSKLEEEEKRLETIKSNSPLSNVNAFFEKLEEKTEESKTRLFNAYKNSVAKSEAELGRYASMLNALSPLAVLGRGYSITKKNGAVVYRAEELKSADEISIVFSDGEINAEVK